ncbi:MAG: hypothetical protein QUV05_20350 [Phycisphaerae bacterium]|nr:hypothetical protein [Phycisphaerae bacterium]
MGDEELQLFELDVVTNQQYWSKMAAAPFVALKLPSKRIPRRQKIVEEQHINETSEILGRARLKP